MDKKDRIKDFIVFVLCDFSELIDEVIYFFEQKNKIIHIDDPFSRLPTVIKDYRDFLNEHLLSLPDGLPKKNDNIIVDKPKDLFDEDEKAIIVNYINDNFRHGFPDGDMSTGSSEMDLNRTELDNYMESYLKFVVVNENIFISFFVQYLSRYLNADKEFHREADKIIEFEKYCRGLDTEVKAPLIKKKKEYYIERLYQAFEKRHFQFEIIFENIKERKTFVDFDRTLINALNIIPKNFENYSIDYSYDFNLGISNANLLYFNYIFYSIEPIQNNYSISDIEKAENDFEHIKKKNSKLITFLNDKGFDNREINITLNLLHLNKFSILKIPYYDLNMDVNKFLILYKFYILDYFLENMQNPSIKDFERLISNHTSFDISSGAQFRKYNKHINARYSHNSYPFKRIKSKVSIIEQKLKINRKKLKPIPELPY